MENSKIDFRVQGRRLRIGLLAEEFYDPKIRGIGGFGYAVKQVASCFSRMPDLGVDITLVMANKVSAEKTLPDQMHGAKILWRTGPLIDYIKRVRNEKFDLLFCLDNLKIYKVIVWSLPLTPCIFWIHDPRDDEDNRQIDTLRFPGQEERRIKGLNLRDLKRFRFEYFLSKAVRRPMLFAAPSELVDGKFKETYGFKPSQITFLPNIVDLKVGEIKKTANPTVIIISRIDPIKRPWLAVFIAERFPEVDFLFLGEQFVGDEICFPGQLPPNLKMLGYVDGQRKIDLLSSAWILLNTSIHEALAISFLEALLCETPLVSCIDPDGLVGRFGVFVGEGGGTGLQLVPKFEEGIRRLLSDPDLRMRLGREGRKWAEPTTDPMNFLTVFHSLCQKALSANKKK